MSHPDAPARPVRWGMGDAAAGFVGALVLSNLAVGVGLAVSGAGELSFAALAAGQIGLWVGLFGVPLLASRRKGRGSLGADFGFTAEPADGWGLVVGGACQLIAVPGFYWLLQQFTGDLDVSGPARELADRAQGPAFLVFALLVTLGAPVVEELFYRGLLLRAAERRYGTTTAVLGSSAIFGLAHFQVVQFPAHVRLRCDPRCPHRQDRPPRTGDHRAHRLQRRDRRRPCRRPLRVRFVLDLNRLTHRFDNVANERQIEVAVSDVLG